MRTFLVLSFAVSGIALAAGAASAQTPSALPSPGLSVGGPMGGAASTAVGQQAPQAGLTSGAITTTPGAATVTPTAPSVGVPNAAGLAARRR